MQQPWKLEWSDDLSIGIPEVDDDHKRFISLINDLNHAIVSRRETAEVGRLVRRLVEDAERHFAHEEALLSQWNYPDVGGHANNHAEVLRELHDILGALERANLDYQWIEAGLKVKDALINCFLTEDMKYRASRRPAPE